MYTCHALLSGLHLCREDWMRRMLLRGSRIADASVIGNLDRNASFFAAQHPEHLSILVVLGASDRATSLLVNLSFVEASVTACRR